MADHIHTYEERIALELCKARGENPNAEFFTSDGIRECAEPRYKRVAYLEVRPFLALLHAKHRVDKQDEPR